LSGLSTAPFCENRASHAQARAINVSRRINDLDNARTRISRNAQPRIRSVVRITDSLLAKRNWWTVEYFHRAVNAGGNAAAGKPLSAARRQAHGTRLSASVRASFLLLMRSEEAAGREWWRVPAKSVRIGYSWISFFNRHCASRPATTQSEIQEPARCWFLKRSTIRTPPRGQNLPAVRPLLTARCPVNTLSYSNCSHFESAETTAAVITVRPSW